MPIWEKRKVSLKSIDEWIVHNCPDVFYVEHESLPDTLDTNLFAITYTVMDFGTYTDKETGETFKVYNPVYIAKVKYNGDLIFQSCFRKASDARRSVTQYFENHYITKFEREANDNA